MGLSVPDGRYVAYGLPHARGPSGLFLRSLAGNQAYTAGAAVADGYLPLSFSQDMKYLYYVDRKAVAGMGYTFYRIPVGGGEPKMLPIHGNGLAQLTRWKQAGHIKRGKPETAHASVWWRCRTPTDRTSGIVLERKAAVPIRGVSWSPDGRELYFIEGTRDVRGVSLQMYAFQVSSGSVRQVIDLGRKAVTRSSF